MLLSPLFPAPDIDWRDIVNPRTGDVTPTPAGIDPGFGHNVGQAFLAALQGA